MLKPVNRKPYADRRAVPLDPASTPTIAQGNVLDTDANGYAVLADGASVVGDPMWAFTKTGRLDSAAADSVSVLEAPFVALVDTDGYVGTPAKDDALKVGTGGNVGKLEVEATVDSVAKLQGIVAYCLAPPNADGFIKIKAIR